jgi:hypothetical protein
VTPWDFELRVEIACGAELERNCAATWGGGRECGAARVGETVTRLRPTTTAGQSTQPSTVSCDDSAQNLPLFPRKAGSLVVRRGRCLAAVTQRHSLATLVPVPSSNFAEL